jgi:hypothetical protein
MTGLVRLAAGGRLMADGVGWTVEERHTQSGRAALLAPGRTVSAGSPGLQVVMARSSGTAGGSRGSHRLLPA